MEKYCPQCGNALSAESKSCPSCAGAPEQPAPTPPAASVPSYLALAIVSALFCWPLGIAAIVYASQVDWLVRIGQHEMAQRYSMLARNWSIGAIGLLVIILFFYFLIWVVMFGFLGLVAVLNH